MPTIPLSARPWSRVKALVYAEETHCWRCGAQVDMRLKYPHPKSKSVDHVIPRSVLLTRVEAGELTATQAKALTYSRDNARLTCLSCNCSAGARKPTPNRVRSTTWA